jgi:iron complex transport system ATP-binding protein
MPPLPLRPPLRLAPRPRSTPPSFRIEDQNEKTPILTVSDLHVRRGDTTILQDVSWEVLRGQHWAILGANGSGKTSLLSALTGYLTPSSGTIAVLGRSYGHADWRELRKQIGLVSSSLRQMMADSEPALETVMSGKQAMIGFWGRPNPRDRSRAKNLLQQVDAEPLEQRRWQVLSQGERQRVLIARALMPKPRLLILDEPCAGLDPAAREHFLQFVDRLGRKAHSPALVLVTHHIEEIMPIFSHVLLLKSGHVLAAGPKSALLKSKLLSQAFATPVQVTNSSRRYTMKIRAQSSLIL